MRPCGGLIVHLVYFTAIMEVSKQLQGLEGCYDVTTEGQPEET